MATFVFLGPSLPRAEAELLLPAIYLDPISMGELYTLVRTRARPGDRVAIIDGFFEQVPAVWHKEILYAIEQGVTVYGASSMGALRAAELHPFGMRGVGRIFEAYRDLVLEDDDEVAVAHAMRDDGYRSLSTAMVSIRFGLDALRVQNRISSEQHDTLCAHAKSQHYNVRSWADTYAYARTSRMGGEVLEAIAAVANQPDAKANDAMALLRHLATTGDTPEAAPVPCFVLEQTGLWRDLVQSQEARVAGESLTSAFSSGAVDAEVLRHVLAVSQDRDALLREALLMKIAMESRWTSAPTDKEMKAAMFRVAARNDLRTTGEVQAWRDKQRLAYSDWTSILEMDARVQQMSLHAIVGLDAYVLAALKAKGQYATAAADVTAIRERYGESWLKQLSADDFGIGYGELQQWYEQHHGPMLPDPETYAQALGFHTLAAFVTHILAQFLLSRDVVQPDAGAVEALTTAL